MKSILATLSVVALAVVGAVPARAGAGASDPSTPWPAPVEAARRAALDGLEDLGAPRSYVRALTDRRSHANTAKGGFLLMPAGDLDGDGGRDVVGLKPEVTPEGVSSTLVAGFDGASGKRLWKRDGPAGYSWASPARFGPRGRPGLLLVSYEFVRSADVLVAGGYILDTHLIALASDGTTAWERTFTGYVADTTPISVATGMTFVSATLDATRGRATDVLIAIQDVLYQPAGVTVRTAAEVLDGADGETGARAEIRSNGEALPNPLPDVTGDDLDDFAFVAVADEGGGAINARRGTDGEDLWTLEAPVDSFTAIEDAGDTTGDGVRDLLLFNECGCFFAGTGPGSPAVPADGGGTFLVGGDGELLWRKRVGIPRLLGDIDDDGRADIGTQALRISNDSSEVVYRAIDGRGRSLYVKRYELAAGARDASDDVIAHADAGDLDGDGIRDAAHEIEFADFGGERFRSERGVISGADGTRLWSAAEIGAPAGGTIDGAGDDMIATHRRGHRLELVARDGRDGDPMWRARVPRLRGAEPELFTTDLTGDGRGEVIVDLVSYDRDDAPLARAYVLDGATGRVLWSA